MSYSTYHYDLLLGQMIRNLGIMELALTNVSAMDFLDPKVSGNRLHVLLFTSFRNHFEKFHTLPDVATARADLAEYMAKYCSTEDAEILIGQYRDFSDMMEHLHDGSIGLAREIVQFVYKSCRFEKEAASLIATATESNYLEGLGRSLQEVEARLHAATGGLATTGNFLKPGTDDGTRAMTGVSFIDSRLGAGGGPMNDCAIGVLGGQGSGKSSLGYQIVCNKCLEGKDALLVLIEESKNQTIMRNLTACITGLSTSVLEIVKDNIDDAIKMANADPFIVRARIATLGKHLHILDMVENPGGIELIDAEVHKIKSGGALIATAYIDWAGLLANYVMSNPPKGHPGFRTTESAVKYIGDSVAGLATKHGGQYFIAHQIAPGIDNKGPFVKLDQYCAADCKGFTQRMKYCFALNKREPDSGVQYFNIVKARHDKNDQRMTVKLDPTGVQFSEAVGWSKSGKKFVNNKGPGAGELPREHGAA